MLRSSRLATSRRVFRQRTKTRRPPVRCRKPEPVLEPGEGFPASEFEGVPPQSPKHTEEWWIPRPNLRLAGSLLLLVIYGGEPGPPATALL